MFVITNVFKNRVIIQDLKLEIQSGQAYDLHKMDLPIAPERSKDLIEATKQGKIKIIKRDIIESSKQEVVVKQSFTKEDMAGIVREEMQKNNSNKEIVELLQKINSSLQNGSSVDSNQKSQGSKEEGLSVDQLSKIHERTVNRLVEKVENKIEKADDNKEKEHDENIEKQLSDLEDFL